MRIVVTRDDQVKVTLETEHDPGGSGPKGAMIVTDETLYFCYPDRSVRWALLDREAVSVSSFRRGHWEYGRGR